MGDKFIVTSKKQDKKEDKSVIMTLRYALKNLEFIPSEDNTK